MPIVWVGAEDLPVSFVNHFVGQVHEGEVFLTFGVLVPPALMGDPEEVKTQVQLLDVVPIRSVARLSTTPQRIREFRTILDKVLLMLDQQAQQDRTEGDDGS